MIKILIYKIAQKQKIANVFMETVVIYHCSIFAVDTVYSGF